MNLALKSTTAWRCAGMLGRPAFADMDAAKAFLDAEIGDVSTLPRADQEAEMQFFVDAAKPYAGMEIKVVSETITTHEYEVQVLAPAFTAITGIKVTHDLIGEGDVVEKLQTQMQSGENIYDAYINDSDLIGTHWRYKQVRNLTDWMAGEGADVTSPTLDLDDFIGTSFTTGPDGKLYQLPTSSSRTSIGSAMTGSTTNRTRPISKPNTAMIWAFRSTGLPTRTSRNSSPAATCRAWTCRAKSLATWTTARKTPSWAGVTPMRGCRWPAWAMWANQTVCPSMNGAFA